MPKAARSLAVLAVSALAAGLAVIVGVAAASTFTLNAAKNVKVTNLATSTSKLETIAVAKGFAVYELSGDSKTHPECTAANQCFSFWPPVKVSSSKHLSKAHGIAGTLGVWRRDGFMQLTLSGHPLYRFSGDGNHKGVANGQGIMTFGGTWHVVSAGSGSASLGTTSTPASTPTPTTPTTPTPPPYTPPY